jgi:hypothetical protein
VRRSSRSPKDPVQQAARLGGRDDDGGSNIRLIAGSGYRRRERLIRCHLGIAAQVAASRPRSTLTRDTPSTLRNALVTRPTQATQVMPVTGKRIVSISLTSTP